MAKLSVQEIIDALKELSVLELNDLVTACEEEFGVSAAAGVAVVAAAGPAAAGARHRGARTDSGPRQAPTPPRCWRNGQGQVRRA